MSKRETNTRNSANEMLDFVRKNPRIQKGLVWLLLIAAKLKDKDLVEDSLLRAKMAACVVKLTGSLNSLGLQGLVLLAIKTNDKGFFIDFGKCLSGEIKDPTLFHKRDYDLAEIVLSRLSAEAAVRELKKRGHPGITEENFRVQKMRLLKARHVVDAVVANDAEFFARLWTRDSQSRRHRRNKKPPLSVTA